MLYITQTRKTRFSPWKRGRDQFFARGWYLITLDDFDEPFDLHFDANIDLDIDAKRAALKVSASIVSLVSQTGPLINRHGEVIGVNFYGFLYTAFLPINIAFKCLEHFEKYGTHCRPYLGMELTNLYAAGLVKLEVITEKFPNVFKGVIVEEVTKGSPADRVGIVPEDVIIECGGYSVQGFLEFFEILFDKAGSKERTVDLVVLRGKTGDRLNLTVAIDEVTAERFNRWPLPDPVKSRSKSLRKRIDWLGRI